MLYLASQSPRRRELLAHLGQPFACLDLDVPEQRQPGEPPEDYVRRVAREKAGAGLLQVMAIEGARVIGADTDVPACAAPNGSYSLSSRLVKPERPPPCLRVRMRLRRPVSILWG